VLFAGGVTSGDRLEADNDVLIFVFQLLRMLMLFLKLVYVANQQCLGWREALEALLLLARQRWGYLSSCPWRRAVRAGRRASLWRELLLLGIKAKKHRNACSHSSITVYWRVKRTQTSETCQHLRVELVAHDFVAVEG